jgi:NhaA family Na+:H+ antiporter
MKKRTGRVFTLAQKQLGIFIATLTKGGNIVITCAILSLVLANSGLGKQFIHMWHYTFHLDALELKFSVEQFINDVFMSFFFLLVGLEIKRELLVGSLSDIKKASLPLAAAFGGMIVPAVIYHYFNHDQLSASGWAIPMATDIAFALAILNILKGRVHQNLIILLTTLAVADDLGAVIVIASFYTAEINFIAIGAMVFFTLLLALCNYRNVKYMLVYIILGIFLWICTAYSGIHATIAGVIFAFTIPLSNDHEAPFNVIMDFLEEPVNYFILPLFAFCNTSFRLSPEYFERLASPIALGIILGLVLGKTIGIFSFSWIATKTGLSKLPEHVNFKQILGISLLGGIGFTMSVFVTLLAFNNEADIEAAKLYIIMGSTFAAIIGLSYLNIVSRPKINANKS